MLDRANLEEELPEARENAEGFRHAFSGNGVFLQAFRTADLFQCHLPKVSAVEVEVSMRRTAPKGRPSAPTAAILDCA